MKTALNDLIKSFAFPQGFDHLTVQEPKSIMLYLMYWDYLRSTYEESPTALCLIKEKYEEKLDSRTKARFLQEFANSFSTTEAAYPKDFSYEAFKWLYETDEWSMDWEITMNEFVAAIFDCYWCIGDTHKRELRMENDSDNGA